jgi:hypothetical protein
MNRKRPTAAQTPTKLPTRKAAQASQSAINDGQRRINGELCRVDRQFVKIFQNLRSELAKTSAFAKADFTAFDRLLKEAYHMSAAVAGIKPPGCDPEYNPDPDWKVLPPPPPPTP